MPLEYSISTFSVRTIFQGCRRLRLSSALAQVRLGHLRVRHNLVRPQSVLVTLVIFVRLGHVVINFLIDSGALVRIESLGSFPAKVWRLYRYVRQWIKLTPLRRKKILGLDPFFVETIWWCREYARAVIFTVNMVQLGIMASRRYSRRLEFFHTWVTCS